MNAHAQGRGDGGCVVKPHAPIYRNSHDDTVIATKDLGDCVSGAAGVMNTDYVFDEENGRLGVIFFPNKNDRGLYQRGWMNAADISRFTWECGCKIFAASTSKECQPFVLATLPDFAYNSCFKEGQSKKRAEILSQSAAAAAPDAAARPSQKALRNDDILTLVKVGLDESLIISKINSAEATDFDLSTEGLVSLKTAKVSNAVIDAMMKRSSSKK